MYSVASCSGGALQTLLLLIAILILISSTSLGPRPKTTPSADRFQYRTRVILEAIDAPDEVWG